MKIVTLASKTCFFLSRKLYRKRRLIILGQGLVKKLHNDPNVSLKSSEGQKITLTSDHQVSRFKVVFKVVVRACHGTYFVAHVFKYLAPNFVSGRPA